MSDDQGATATTEKKKVNRQPQSMLLVTPDYDDAGNITAFRVVPQPELSGDKHRRDDYHRGVRKVLEEATDETRLNAYNGTALTVVSFPAPKTLSVEVKETVVRKTVITEQ